MNAWVFACVQERIEKLKQEVDRDRRGLSSPKPNPKVGRGLSGLSSPIEHKEYDGGDFATSPLSPHSMAVASNSSPSETSHHSQQSGLSNLDTPTPTDVSAAVELPAPAAAPPAPSAALPVSDVDESSEWVPPPLERSHTSPPGRSTLLALPGRVVICLFCGLWSLSSHCFES